MHVRSLGLCLAISAAALPAACGGSQPPIGAPSAVPQSRANVTHAERGGSRLKQRAWRYDGGYTFVAQWWSSNVNGYPIGNRGNYGPTCYLGPVDAAQGMTVDGSGTLYVTSAFNGGKLGVATFAPNCGAEGSIYYDPYGIPSDVVTDRSVLYVSNESDGSLAPTVVLYDTGGNGSPEAQLFDPTVSQGIGVAVNSHHDLFWSTKNVWSGGGQVIEFHRGKMPGVVLRETKIGTDVGGGVLVDKADDLLFIDETAEKIYEFAPPYHAPPFAAIALKGNAVFCAFSPSQKQIHCLDDQYGAVDVYTYPKGAYLYSYTNGIDEKEAPTGIAIQPPIRKSR